MKTTRKLKKSIRRAKRSVISKWRQRCAFLDRMVEDEKVMIRRMLDEGKLTDEVAAWSAHSRNNRIYRVHPPRPF